MATMNISLPDSMKDFVEEECAKKGSAPSVSMFVRLSATCRSGKPRTKKLTLTSSRSST